jgi:hypothetical protein
MPDNANVQRAPVRSAGACLAVQEIWLAVRN